MATFSPDERRIEIAGNSGKAVADEPWVSGVELACPWPAAVPPVALALHKK